MNNIKRAKNNKNSEAMHKKDFKSEVANVLETIIINVQMIKLMILFKATITRVCYKRLSMIFEARLT